MPSALRTVPLAAAAFALPLRRNQFDNSRGRRQRGRGIWLPHIGFGHFSTRSPLQCETGPLQYKSLRDAVSRLEAEVIRLETGAGVLPPIHRIVLTGGPCAGKSTVIGDIKQVLEDRNFLVSVMPEVATQVYEWSNGRLWADHRSERLSVDKTVMFIELQIAMEDAIMRMARNSLAVRSTSPVTRPKGMVILYDRGLADYKAYCSPAQWHQVLEILGTTMARLRDRRYDLVIHLVTAANGAEEYYTLSQAEGFARGSEAEGFNHVTARHESPEEARQLDVQVSRAWRGFANIEYVDNRADFSAKRQRVKDLILEEVGEQTGERRDGDMHRVLCKIKGVRLADASLQLIARQIREMSGEDNCKQISVSMVYVSDEVRLLRRMLKGEENPTYYSQTMGKDGRVSRQYQINSWTYVEKIRAAKDAGVLSEERFDELIVYSKENESIRYHVFTDSFDRKGNASKPREPMILAEIDGYVSNGAGIGQLPAFLEFIKDVTDDNRYSICLPLT